MWQVLVCLGAEGEGLVRARWGEGEGFNYFLEEGDI